MRRQTPSTGHFLDYSALLLLIIAASASYCLVMIANSYFYVNPIGYARAETSVQWRPASVNSNPSSSSSMISLYIENQVYSLPSIPLPGSSNLSFDWNITASSVPDGTASIQFSHDNSTWSNLVSFELVSGHAKGRQPIDSSWASPGMNYLRASYWLLGSNLLSLVLILGIFVNGPASLTSVTSSIFFSMSTTQVYYLAGIPPSGSSILSFDWNISASSLPDGKGSIQFSHDNFTWSNLVPFSLTGGETYGRQPIDSSWASPGTNYLRASYLVSGINFHSQVLTLRIVENYAASLTLMTSPVIISVVLYVGVHSLSKRNFVKSVLGLRLKREYLPLLIIVAIGATYVYSTMASTPLYIDEIAYATLAHSLAQGHIATDSSFIQIYEKFGAVTNSIHVQYGHLDSAEPWLDHPPLVSMILVPIILTSLSPRLLPIIFASMTTFLIFFILRGNRLLAWISALTWMGLFLTHPVLSMLFLDSGVGFFNLLTVTMVNEYEKSRRGGKWLYVGGIAAGASALSKLGFGLAGPFYLLIYVIYTKIGPRRESLTTNLKPFLLSIGIASIWPLYGLTTAAPLFIQILTVNASRSAFSGDSIGLAKFIYSIVWSVHEIHATTIDVTLIVGLVAMTYSLFRSGLRIVQTAALTYLAVVLMLRYVQFTSMIPLFPFYAIGIGAIITDSVQMAHKRIMDHLTLEIQKRSH